MGNPFTFSQFCCEPKTTLKKKVLKKCNFYIMLPYSSLTFCNSSHIIQHKSICNNKKQCHSYSNVPAKRKSKYGLYMLENPHADRF